MTMVHSGLKASVPTEKDEMMTSHTPGPWSVPHFADPGTGCECGYVLTDGYMGAVCTVHASGEGGRIETGDNPRFPEAVANAHLIAAAPELLEAAKAALISMTSVGVVMSGDIHENDPALALLRAAIAKATLRAAPSTCGTERSGVNQA